MRGLAMQAMVLSLILAGVCGCPNGQTQQRVQPISLPKTIVALEGKAGAFRVTGKPGQVYPATEIPIAKIGLEGGESAGAGYYLVSYEEPRVRQRAHRWRGESLYADLRGGETYVVFEKPVGHLKDAYRVLGEILKVRKELMRPDVNIMGNICHEILCAPDMIQAEALFDKYPTLGKFRDRLNFQGAWIGGWIPGASGSICDQCTTFRGRRATPVIPDLTTWLAWLTERYKGPVFSDTFDHDTAGNPPSGSPPGDPDDDSVTSSGSAEVVESSVTGSRALKLTRTTQDSRLNCILGKGPHDSGTYTVQFDAYAGDHDDYPLSITMKCSSGASAFRLQFRDGKYTLYSGDGEEDLTGIFGGMFGSVGPFGPEELHNVRIEIDMDEGTFSIFINDIPVAINRSFLNSGCKDLDSLEFSYGKMILESRDGTYFVDKIHIEKNP